MCRITVNLTKTNNDKLRKLNRTKGDLSKYINQALETYLHDNFMLAYYLEEELRNNQEEAKE
jgi:hypothetical protein